MSEGDRAADGVGETPAPEATAAIAPETSVVAEWPAALTGLAGTRPVQGFSVASTNAGTMTIGVARSMAATVSTAVVCLPGVTPQGPPALPQSPEPSPAENGDRESAPSLAVDAAAPLPIVDVARPQALASAPQSLEAVGSLGAPRNLLAGVVFTDAGVSAGAVAQQPAAAVPDVPKLPPSSVANFALPSLPAARQTVSAPTPSAAAVGAPTTAPAAVVAPQPDPPAPAPAPPNHPAPLAVAAAAAAAAAAPPATFGGQSRPDAPPAPPLPRARRGLGGWLRKGLRWLVLAAAAYAAICLALILAYRFIDPPASTLMVWKRLTGTQVDQRWVPISRISPHLIRAVIASEDARFCHHNGVDLEEIRAAIKRARDGIPRGASTISMQVAKNLFLWPSRSYLRKAIEIPLTLTMELVWPKRRMLEIYLNIAEWGDGIFGAEAASRHHFEKSASRLSRSEAALLAVALPNPFVRQAGDPGRGTRRLAGRIKDRVEGGGGPAGCVLLGRKAAEKD